MERISRAMGPGGSEVDFGKESKEEGEAGAEEQEESGKR